MARDSHLRIGQLQLECFVAHPDGPAQALLERLQRTARRGLPDALSQALEPLADAGEGLVFIRRLELEMDIDSALEDAEIARVWARRLQLSLLRKLGRSSEAQVVSFPNRAEYLAQALRQILCDGLGDLWYLREFDGLRPLPRGAALRTALCAEDPACAARALALLDSAQRLAVCASLAEADALRVVDAVYLRSAPHAPLSAQDSAALAALATQPLAALRQLPGDAQRSLWLAIALCGAQPRPGIARLLPVIACLAGMRDADGQIAEALRDASVSALRQVLEPQQLAALLPVLQAGGATREVLARLPAAASGVEPARRGVEASVRSTRFGSAFLLFPHVLQLPEAIWRNWPAPAQQERAALLHWLVLCCCMGGEYFLAAADDPLLRDMCGVGPAVTAGEALAWLDAAPGASGAAPVFAMLAAQCGEPVPEDVTSAQADADFDFLWPRTRLAVPALAGVLLPALASHCLRAFARRLPGFGSSSLAYISSNFLGMSASLVVRDGELQAHLTRAPMSVILNMAGINRGCVDITALSPRPIRLVEVT
ncbi:hypothetical protein E4634_01075 [Mangrovimicrobium sediminis]|uniref:Uncharacterized protein n=1 Tax=Mangrovimicrobium sediminis TaxID=2562682 RepID=A0A4Z0M9V3_9GAMM|nr:hypothetical protein [Haliea sp. SAOS-164]TGD76170.1 hypothetical protein E4634_01075 [Haliea sp. SAOS-164]